MNINEAGVLLSKITVSYPNFKVNDHKLAAAVWAETLENETLEDVNKALKIYNREAHEFAPSPGQLIAIIKKYKPKSESPMEMLNKIRIALKNASYGAEEEFKRLPKAAQMAVGSPGELRRISHAGLDSYMENTLTKRMEEAMDIIQTREEHMAIEQKAEIKRIGKVS